jgi:hypothetical protein
MSGINSGVERSFTMKIAQFLGAALAVTMLSGAVVSAQAAQVTGPQAVIISHPANTDAEQAMAQGASQRTQRAATALRPIHQPRKLQFANFGQWDEAGSEN